MKKIIRTLASYPSGLLLFVQLVSIIIHPMLETVKFNQAIFSCFNVAALSLAVCGREPQSCAQLGGLDVGYSSSFIDNFLCN